MRLQKAKNFSSKLILLALGLLTYLNHWSSPVYAQDILNQSTPQSHRSEDEKHRFLLELDPDFDKQKIAKGVFDKNGKVYPAAQSSNMHEVNSKIDANYANITVKEIIKNAQKFGLDLNIKTWDGAPFISLNISEENLEKLKEDPRVLRAEKQRPISPQFFLTRSSAFEPINASVQFTADLIGAQNAWKKGFTGAGWHIAILDTGIATNNPDIHPKVTSEWCYSKQDKKISESLCPKGKSSPATSIDQKITDPGSGVNCDPAFSICAHGTFVAGIAAAKGAINGIAKDAKVISIQVFSKFLKPENCTNGAAPCIASYPEDQATGLYKVLDLHKSGKFKIAAVNLSLGGGEHKTTCDDNKSDLFFKLVKKPIESLRAHGIATIAASGNDGYKNAINFPACLSSTISVGNVSNDGRVARESNNADFLSLLAPGTDIHSTFPGRAKPVKLSGTSMAAPHVAGSWAILKQAFPQASVEQIYTALIKSGTPQTDLYSRPNITKKMIRVDKAMKHLQSRYLLKTLNEKDLSDKETKEFCKKNLSEQMKIKYEEIKNKKNPISYLTDKCKRY